ncbi:MAG: DUF1822 family protein [Cyanobacteria bacterium P01_D01_bin.50]
MQGNNQMLSIDDLSIVYPENLWLEFSALDREKIWDKTVVNHSQNAAARHRAFINYLCFNAFIKWLEDEPDLQEKFCIPPMHQDLHFNRWEFVNGIEFTFNQSRIVLVPSEQGSISEFRIPQEWIDIPDWAANYYLAVQLNIEANWLRIWGFISYEEVLQKAQYDLMDRTYCLKNRDLIADINIMWVAQELCMLEKPQVKPIPCLSEAKAQEIIKQLSKSTVYSPRLDINFNEWGAILASDEYRQILYNQRIKNLQIQQLVDNTAKVVQNLSLWLEGAFHEGWQSVDDLLSFTDTTTFQFRSDSVLNEVCVKGAKLIDLGIQLENKSVVLLIGLSPQIDNKVGIRVQLYPAFGENYLPASLKLTLLSESGKILQCVESRSYDNYIQLKRFKLPLGKFFSIQVAFKDIKIKENFILEGLGVAS